MDARISKLWKPKSLKAQHLKLSHAKLNVGFMQNVAGMFLSDCKVNDSGVSGSVHPCCATGHCSPFLTVRA